MRASKRVRKRAVVFRRSLRFVLLPTAWMVTFEIQTAEKTVAFVSFREFSEQRPICFKIAAFRQYPHCTWPNYRSSSSPEFKREFKSNLIGD